MNRIATATALEDLDAFENDDMVADAVMELGIEAPRLGQTRPASDHEGAIRWNVDRTMGSRTRRFYLAVSHVSTGSVAERGGHSGEGAETFGRRWRLQGAGSNVCRDRDTLLAQQTRTRQHHEPVRQGTKIR